MSIRAIPNLMIADYVPNSDRDADVKTVFKLRPLNGMQHMEVLREYVVDPDDKMKGSISARGLILALKYGLAGWENFHDIAGAPIAFIPDHIGRIPPFTLHEIAIEILNRSDLGETDRKN